MRTRAGACRLALVVALAAIAWSCTSDPATHGEVSTTLPASSSSTDTGTGGFIDAKDGGAEPETCNLLDDPCPEGEKCSAYAADGGSVPDSTRCVPVAPSPQQVDEPCTVQDWIASGLDDCDRGLTCWDVDVETLEGRCVPLCTNPTPQGCADPDRRCLMGGGPLLVCLLACNPLDPACLGDDACYPLDDWLSCIPDASGMDGFLGDPCAFINGCKPGLYCAAADQVPGCMTDSCCTPFCAVSQGGADCPATPTQTCLPYFADPPTGLEDVGLCGVM